MDITNLSSDMAILEEIGHRLARIRLQNNMTQAALATEAGISKPTMERIESGRDAQVTSLIRVLRALDLLYVLGNTIPETSPSPMELLKAKGRERKRASSTTTQKTNGATPWSWGDEK